MWIVVVFVDYPYGMWLLLLLLMHLSMLLHLLLFFCSKIKKIKNIFQIWRETTSTQTSRQSKWLLTVIHVDSRLSKWNVVVFVDDALVAFALVQK